MEASPDPPKEQSKCIRDLDDRREQAKKQTCCVCGDKSNSKDEEAELVSLSIK
jgi:hypothetical protein